jgi:RNA-directed DNA polymerase
VKRFSVQAIRQALVGTGNLRTRISDRIEELDPYDRVAARKFKEIFDDEALKGWLQIQKLFSGIPKITALENTWSVVAHNPELVALMLRGVALEKDKVAISRSRKLFKLTEIETAEDTFSFWVLNGDFKKLPNLLEATGFSKIVRVRWSLAKKINENVTSYSELLKIASAVEDFPAKEANKFFIEAINHLNHSINKISQDEATCFNKEEMSVFSYQKDLIPFVYENTKRTGQESAISIEKLQFSYRRNVDLTTDILNRLAQRDWKAAGASAEKIQVGRTAELAVKKVVPSAEHIVEITSGSTFNDWEAMSDKGYEVILELFPKGSIKKHWTYSFKEIIKKLKDESLEEKKLTQADILHLNKSWSTEDKAALIQSQKFMVINPDSPVWKMQSLKTLLHSASVREEENAEKFLVAHLDTISGADEVLASIISINNKKTSEILKSFMDKWIGHLKRDGISAGNWNELIARKVGTINWLIAKEKFLIENANIEQVLYAIQVSSENRLLEDFKKLAIEVFQNIKIISEIQAKKIISALRNDPTFINLLGPHLNSNVIKKIVELSEVNSSNDVIKKLYEVVKEEYKVSLWEMQINHVTKAQNLIELSIEGINKGYKSEWQHRWKHVAGSVEERARALALCTSAEPSRLQKIKVDFTEQALTKAMLWASAQISEKHKFKKVYLELTSALGLRHASTLQWLLLQRSREMPSGSKLDHLYVKHDIPKKSGKLRTISAPNSGLKRIQKSININLFEPLGAHEAAYGFVKGKSIVGNAALHVGKPIVVNTDVQNCFPSVRWPLVHAALKRDLSGKLSNNAISALIDMCTAEGVLPIGAPTSPSLLNRVLYKTDEILSKQANLKNCTYSRYADDLTFSGDDQAVGLIGAARKTLSQIGLELDDKKTNIFRRGRRQMCTGLVVNDKVNIPRRIRKRIRASVHAYELGKDLFWDADSVGESSLRGRLEFLKMVSPKSSEKLHSRFIKAHKLKLKAIPKPTKKKKSSVQK